MATEAYWEWDRAGRPYRLATPIEELKKTFRAHQVAFLGDIGDEERHLKVDHPRDHTPFPENPWPVPLPPKPAGYVVCAVDHADGPWSDRILADARAGRLPWLKYFNFRGHHYDLRRGWAEEPSTDWHLHISIRSDWIDRSIAGYDPIARAGVTMGIWEEIITNQTAQTRQGGGGSAKDFLIETAFHAGDAAAGVKRIETKLDELGTAPPTLPALPTAAEIAAEIIKQLRP